MVRRFDEIWIPDNETLDDLSGKLGHPSRPGAQTGSIHRNLDQA
jgi:hypothetical protein